VALPSAGVQRLRELMAHGGIAVLAIVFAVALAIFDVAREIGRETISILSQKLYDEDGEDPLGFTIAGTEVHWGRCRRYSPSGSSCSRDPSWSAGAPASSAPARTARR